MPRKGHVQKREILPDPMYNSKLVTSLIDHLMIDGKRGTATKILQQHLMKLRMKQVTTLQKFSNKLWKTLCLFLKLRLVVLVVQNYQVPIEVRPERRTTLGLRWIVQYARLRGEHTMVERLAREIIDASNNTGASVKKREDTHRMAEANRAFAHYRW